MINDKNKQQFDIIDEYYENVKNEIFELFKQQKDIES